MKFLFSHPVFICKPWELSAMAGDLVRTAFPSSGAWPSRTWNPLWGDCVLRALKITVGSFTEMSDSGLIVLTKYKVIKDYCQAEKKSPYEENITTLLIVKYVFPFPDGIISITYDRSIYSIKDKWINKMCTHSGVIFSHKQQSQVWWPRFVVSALERLKKKKCWEFKANLCCIVSSTVSCPKKSIFPKSAWRLRKKYTLPAKRKNSFYLWQKGPLALSLTYTYDTYLVYQGLCYLLGSFSLYLSACYTLQSPPT